MGADMKCMNCQQDAVGFFEGVPVCKDCKRIADHAMAKTENQLKALLVVQRELLRATIVEGRLVLGGNPRQDSDAARVPAQVPELGVQKGPEKGDGGEL